MFLSRTYSRLVATCSHGLVWISSIIVTGILSYLIHESSHTSAHIKYEEVIATVTLAILTLSMVLPVISQSYRGHLFPLYWILSYLWLTSFIFSAQDWAGGRCSYQCRLKKTVAAFNFVAFFFLLTGICAESKIWSTANTIVDEGDVTKQRRGSAVVPPPGV